MPFTISHIAAVLPVHRPLTRAHVFTAAVIGSMAPDFGLLLPNVLVRWHTHSVAALFSFCLPVGLCAYWLTLLLIKPAVQEVAPDRAYLRLRVRHPSVALTNPLHWVYAALALLAGAATHLIWDDFTHEDARGVRMFPALSDYEPEMVGHSLQLYRWLQYGSSIFGLAVVARGTDPVVAPCAATGRAAGTPHRAGRAPGVEQSVCTAAATDYGLVPRSFPRRRGRRDPQRRGGGMRGAAVSLLLISVLIRARLAA